MTAAPLDTAAIMADHPHGERHFCHGVMLTNDQGCQTYRLAADLAAAQADVKTLEARSAYWQRRVGRVEAALAGEGEDVDDAIDALDPDCTRTHGVCVWCGHPEVGQPPSASGRCSFDGCRCEAVRS